MAKWLILAVLLTAPAEAGPKGYYVHVTLPKATGSALAQELASDALRRAATHDEYAVEDVRTGGGCGLFQCHGWATGRLRGMH